MQRTYIADLFISQIQTCTLQHINRFEYLATLLLKLIQACRKDTFGFEIAKVEYYVITNRHELTAEQTDDRTFGELFYACCEEVFDISFVEALYRIMTLAGNRLKTLGRYCEKKATALFDTIMEAALQSVGLFEDRKLS